MNKQHIRNTIGQKNRSLSADKRALAESEIFQQIERLDEFLAAHTIALFVALPDEVSTLETIHRWHDMGKQVVLPVVEGGQMQLYSYTPNALIEGKYKILTPDTQICKRVEPHSLDLMIVPGVAFTTQGDRLGRGGGFYDRYLSDPTLRATTIGICYAHQLLDSLPTLPHDICVKKVVHSSL